MFGFLTILCCRSKILHRNRGRRRNVINQYTVARWKKTIEIKECFEKKMKCSIYDVLPNVIQNTFSNK